MSTPSERVTEAELARSRKARAIAKNWLEAESTRLKLAGLDPELDGDGVPGVQMRPSKFGRPSALERVKEARISGLEIKEFTKGLNDESASSSNSASIDPTQILDRKAKIAATLAGMKYSPDEIRGYLSAIGPFLDSSSFASDPWAQRYLLEKFQAGQNPTRNDIIEAVRLGSEMNRTPSQNPVDLGKLMEGMASMFRAGADASKNSSSPSDPVATLNAIFPLVEKMNEAQRSSFETQLTTLREELRDRDPSEFVETMKRYSDLFGWIRQPDSESVATAKLQAAQENSKMAFELERERWRAQMEDKRELNKQRAQSELLSGITGTLTRAFESPVVKELGRSVGQRLGTKNPLAPLSEAKVTAAREQLENPLGAIWSFQCPKCHTNHKFTTLELTKIRETSGSRWVCSSCGDAYTLGPDKQGGGVA